ncbi:hypothetical protein PPYR_03799 [Photinus pyralis]|uniref:alpha-glucosidase n=1 Tax=Photinus pyralis TaxID=7054 RepID=A0A1Y1L2U1_PHOPY|nr:uncharacterized protein LOC116162683 isoform X2 [Photinus pyralis]XP_031357842.1 uncharacterized protein LOC116181609 isoform X2 [Photinus pyralis]KAB0790684.1 hypothetical protein PPYR_14864 [Photinus pyralis]KAB0801613.1 hypothetical protein PPYR_03799 [Photinus pyralis]
MDSTKLDISAKPDKESPSAVYKQIPEVDMEEAAVEQSKRVLKAKSNGMEKDGADEKMLPEDDVKVGDHSKINVADVKFVSNEKQNGDAKVDIGEIKSAFVGLTKEELLKCANDPFWVRLRWFLFIFFWLLWAGMLVGAILIIVAAPKCSPPEPRTWWEEGPLTEVDADVTEDELKQLKDSGIQGVIVTWPDDVYIPINISHKFISFLKRSNETKINVIVDLKPGTSSKWFSKAEDKENDGEFTDYYIWAQPKKSTSGEDMAPNNWKSRQNTSSWKFSQKLGKYYLSPDDSPQLNFTNPKVVNEFSNVLHSFIEAGVKGIRLTGAPYLLVDPGFKDDGISQLIGFGLTDYGFYTHTNTEYLPDLGRLLNQWREIVKDKAEGGPFMLSESLKDLDAFKVNNSLVIDLPLQARVFSSNKQLLAPQINNDLNSVFLILENKYWPLWQHTSSAVPENVLNIVTMLLPGATLLSKNSTISKDLLTIRKSDSVMHGNTDRYLVANNTVFAYIRFAPGNPGYIVMFNPSSERVLVDLPTETSLKFDDVTVQYYSNNYNETNVVKKKATDPTKVPLSPESAIVISYVPQSK